MRSACAAPVPLTGAQRTVPLATWAWHTNDSADAGAVPAGGAMGDPGGGRSTQAAVSAPASAAIAQRRGNRLITRVLREDGGRATRRSIAASAIPCAPAEVPSP